MAVVRFDLFPGLRIPLDGGRTFRGDRIFGDNKTWRGVVAMVSLSALLGAVQGLLLGPWAASAGLACMDFEAWGAGGGGVSWSVGYAVVNLVLGLGYVLGELPNSFAKRQGGIAPGGTGEGARGRWFRLLDQSDSVIATLGLGTIVFGWGIRFFLMGVPVLAALHLGINACLILAGLRKRV
jgi:hypothetical protein